MSTKCKNLKKKTLKKLIFTNLEKFTLINFIYTKWKKFNQKPIKNSMCTKWKKLI